MAVGSEICCGGRLTILILISTLLLAVLLHLYPQRKKKSKEWGLLGAISEPGFVKTVKKKEIWDGRRGKKFVVLGRICIFFCFFLVVDSPSQSSINQAKLGGSKSLFCMSILPSFCCFQMEHGRESSAKMGRRLLWKTKCAYASLSGC